MADKIFEHIGTLLKDFELFLPRFAAALLCFFASWILAILFKTAVLYTGKLLKAANRDVYGLMGSTGKITIIFIGLIFSLSKMGIDITALVAGLGLTGFALGFALRDVLSNIIAGALLFIYRPFRINDKIAVTGLEGVVKQIDLRYTALESDSKTYLIPNSILFTNAIHIAHDGNRQ